MDLRQIFFQGLGKQLFIKTCIEKHCIRPLNSLMKWKKTVAHL